MLLVLSVPRPGLFRYFPFIVCTQHLPRELGLCLIPAQEEPDPPEKPTCSPPKLVSSEASTPTSPPPPSKKQSARKKIEEAITPHPLTPTGISLPSTCSVHTPTLVRTNTHKFTKPPPNTAISCAACPSTIYGYQNTTPLTTDPKDARTAQPVST